MRTLLTSLLSPALPAGADDVHFHAGGDGPYVCDNPRCDSPHLDTAAEPAA